MIGAVLCPKKFTAATPLDAVSRTITAAGR